MPPIFVKIKRQNDPESDSYWEDFKVQESPGMTVISLLQQIQRKPVNARGEVVAPVVWESSCLEEVCGSCTMIINGRVALSCSSFVTDLARPISLEPLKKFPVVRDLMVNKAGLGKLYYQIKDWAPFDGIQGSSQEINYREGDGDLAKKLATCINCAACLEACPQYNSHSPFIGALFINKARLFNLFPGGKTLREERLDKLMDKGGVEDCDNAGNCALSCPKDIPLLESLADCKRQVTIRAFKKIL